MLTDPYARAAEAGAALRDLAPAPPVAVVLGSGLGAFADSLRQSRQIPYETLPHFPNVSVSGHTGQLVLGGLDAGVKVAALAGRVHLYEGHPTAHVVHAVRALASWGVRAIVITNAAGGINPAHNAGDLMIISDHLNMTGTNPLIGHNPEGAGQRFPDMSAAYDPRLREILRATGTKLGLELQEGVYAGLMGPSYETPAEIRMLRTLGADAVGMSTVCEVIAARHAGVRVCGISCITNLAAGLGNAELHHDEVKETAAKVRDDFVSLLREGLQGIADEVIR